MYQNSILVSYVMTKKQFFYLNISIITATFLKNKISKFVKREWLTCKKLPSAEE